MSAVWMKREPELLDFTRDSWESIKEYPEPATPDSTQNVQELVLHFKKEPGGVTITCPAIELAMCGKTEGDAWQRFLDAYNDLKDLLEENEQDLSLELKEQLAIVRNQPVFQFVREP